MRTNPLRVEFVLSGFAFLLATFALVVAIRFHRDLCPLGGRGGECVNFNQWQAPEELLGSGAVFVVVLIAAAYVIGIALVQLTFFWPTQPLIRRVLERRFRALAALDKRVRCPSSPDHRAPSTDAAHDAEGLHAILRFAFEKPEVGRPYTAPDRLKWVFAFLGKWKWIERRISELVEYKTEDQEMSDRRHATTLALTVGRALAPSEVAEEYKYRRSNRQVFVGMLPSAAVAGAASVIAAYEVHLLLALAAALIAGLIIALFFESARFQEKVAQALLVDIAFLRYWQLLPPDGPGEDKPPTTSD